MPPRIVHAEDSSSSDDEDLIITPASSKRARLEKLNQSSSRSTNGRATTTRASTRTSTASQKRKRSAVIDDDSDGDNDDNNKQFLDSFLVSDSDSDSAPKKRKKSTSSAATKAKKNKKEAPVKSRKTRTVKMEEDDGDDIGIAKAKKVKAESDDDDDDDEMIVPSKTKSKAKKTSTKTKKTATNSKKSAVKKEAKVKTEKKTKVKTEKKTSTTDANGKAKELKKEEEDEHVYKWWREETLEEIERKQFSQKWTTLKHNGVLFPPEYEPHGIKVLYDGEPVSLTPAQEEVATMFAVMRESDYYNNPTFRKNFWNDFKKILGPKHKIKSLDKIDFTPIWQWFLDERERKKKMTREEKKAIKEEKDKLEEPYKYAWVDGYKEAVGNFRVEPPGLFRGRGEHPLMGKLKARVRPEDITINIGKIDDAPPPPEGHKWKEVISDPNVSWIAMWRENIKGDFKYVGFAADSSIKGRSDFIKFETARKLKHIIDDIRKQYKKDWKSKDLLTKQRAVAIYFIDRLALRAGNEKDEDEADTVGCCSLRVEHVTLKGNNRIEFDFLGKDSIRYLNEVEVEPQVYKLMGEFMKGKKKADNIFDQITTTTLNAHLKTIMDKLSAKVFRTFNASLTLQEQLAKDEHKLDKMNLTEKLAYYNNANREVAILCNHQRTVPKTFQSQVERIDERLEELHEYIANLKKAKKDLAKKEREVVKKAWVEKYEKKKKRYEKELEKYEEDVKRQEELRRKRSLEIGSSSAAKKKKQQKAKSEEDEFIDKVLVKPFKPPSRALPRNAEAIDNAIAKTEKRIKDIEAQKKMKMDNKTVALGTSKINYCDPRITVAWCKRHDVPLTKIFSKTLLRKFPWATDVDPDFIF